MQKQQPWEFGGPLGCAAMVLFFPALLLYFNCHFGGDFRLPSKESWEIYLYFVAFEFVLAKIMPGITVNGLPLANGQILSYNCNGLCSFYFTLLVSALLHYLGWFNLASIALQYQGLLKVSIAFSFALSFLVYLEAFYSKSTTRMSGFLY